MLILVLTVTGCVSISAFASLVCVRSAWIKKYRSIISWRDKLIVLWILNRQAKIFLLMW